MHVDLAGPYERSVDGYHYILICALRLRGAPMVIFGSCLKTKGATEVVQEIASLVNWIESLNVGVLPPVGQKRVFRIQSDRGLEFCNASLAKWCHEHSAHHSKTIGYDPQSNGTAERCVGIVRTVARRLLTSAKMDSEFWSWAVRYCFVCLLCQALRLDDSLPPFGAHVAVRKLRIEKGVSAWHTKSLTGRLAMYDLLRDQSSYLLLEGEGEFEVVRAGKPTELHDYVPESVPLDLADVQPTWRLLHLPTGTPFWLHIPTLKISLEAPLTVESEQPVIELDNSECCLEQRVVQGEAVEIDDYSSPPTAASTSITQLGVEIVEWYMNPRRKEGWSQILFGAFTNRGGGVSSDTTVEAEKLEVLNKLGRTRPYPQNPYWSIAINVVKGDWIPWHTDARNHGSTDLIFLGEFKGGVFSAISLDKKMRERDRSRCQREVDGFVSGVSSDIAFLILKG